MSRKSKLTRSTPGTKRSTRPRSQPLTAESWHQHFRRMKRQVAYQVALGRRNQAIRRRLHLPYPLHRYLEEEGMEELVLQIREMLDQRAELAKRELLPLSIDAMRKRLRGRPIRDAKTGKVIDYLAPELSDIQFLWKALGVIEEPPAQPQAPGQLNVMVNDREDAIAAMELLRKERKRIAEEKATIELTETP